MREKERNKSVDLVANTFGNVCVCFCRFVYLCIVCFWSPELDDKKKERKKKNKEEYSE